MAGHMARAVFALHDADIVHRDIKIANLVWASDTVKVLLLTFLVNSNESLFQKFN